MMKLVLSLLAVVTLLAIGVVSTADATLVEGVTYQMGFDGTTLKIISDDSQPVNLFSGASGKLNGSTIVWQDSNANGVKLYTGLEVGADYRIVSRDAAGQPYVVEVITMVKLDFVITQNIEGTELTISNIQGNQLAMLFIGDEKLNGSTIIRNTISTTDSSKTFATTPDTVYSIVGKQQSVGPFQKTVITTNIVEEIVEDDIIIVTLYEDPKKKSHKTSQTAPIITEMSINGFDVIGDNKREQIMINPLDASGFVTIQVTAYDKENNVEMLEVFVEGKNFERTVYKAVIYEDDGHGVKDNNTIDTEIDELDQSPTFWKFTEVDFKDMGKIVSGDLEVAKEFVGTSKEYKFITFTITLEISEEMEGANISLRVFDTTMLKDNYKVFNALK